MSDSGTVLHGFAGVPTASNAAAWSVPEAGSASLGLWLIEETHSGTHVVFVGPDAAARVVVATGPSSPVESGHDDLTDEDVRNYVSSLWAEDWDSPEDQLYDLM